MAKKTPGIQSFQKRLNKIIPDLDIIQTNHPVFIGEDEDDLMRVERIDKDVISFHYAIPEQIKMVVFTGKKEWIVLDFYWEEDKEVVATLNANKTDIEWWSSDRMFDIIAFTQIWESKAIGEDWQIYTPADNLI